LRQLDRGQANDGTFWMEYADFLVRFCRVDVLKARPTWPLVWFADEFLPAANAYEICNDGPPTWCSVLLVQASPRGIRHQRRHAHSNSDENTASFQPSDCSVLVCRGTAEAQGALEAVTLSGAASTVHVELLLDRGRHLVLPLSLGARPGRRKFVLRIRSEAVLRARPAHVPAGHDLHPAVVRGLRRLSIGAHPAHVDCDGTTWPRVHIIRLLDGVGRLVTVRSDAGVALAAVANTSRFWLRLQMVAVLTQMRLHSGTAAIEDTGAPADGEQMCVHHGVVCDGCGQSPILGLVR
jgi:hypothetical protein